MPFVPSKGRRYTHLKTIQEIVTNAALMGTALALLAAAATYLSGCLAVAKAQRWRPEDDAAPSCEA